MSDAHSNPADQDSELDTIIAGYLEAIEGGQSPDREALIEAHPQYADELRSFFTDQDDFAKAAEPFRADVLPGDSAKPSDGPVNPDAATIDSIDGDEAKFDNDSILHDPPDPMPGEFVRYFGDYELIQEIARGGMGVVYEARQTTLNRSVALKMILAGQLATEQEVKRFHQEAEAAANLEHRHIVPIHEIGQYKGRHYFTMQLVEGGSLDEHLPRLKGDLRAAATLMAKVAQAVHFAHQRSILHRDLKPANILLDVNDEPHITDFGLAKRVDADKGHTLTHAGAVVGTPAYMPPEQALGETLTTSADVYSLGAILYVLLTGQPPFRGKTPMDTMRMVVESEPAPPRSLNASVPPDLGTICLKCLEKEPERRYSSADELAKELDRWLNHQPIEARRVGVAGKLARWSRRNPQLAAAYSVAAIIVVLLTIGSYINLRSEQADLLDQYRQSSAWRHNAEVQSEIGKDALARARYEQAQAVLLSGRPGRRAKALELLGESNQLRNREIDIFLEQRAEISRTFPRRLKMTTLSTFKKRRDEIDPDLDKFLDHWRPLPLAKSADQEKWSNPYTNKKETDSAPITIPSVVDLRNEAIAALLTQDARVISELTTMSGVGTSAGLSADGSIVVTPWMDIDMASDMVSKPGQPTKVPQGGLRVLDTINGREIGRFKNLAMMSMYFGGTILSPDGKRFVSMGPSDVGIWSLPDGKRIGTLKTPAGDDGKPLKAYRFAFRPDGKELAAFCTDKPLEGHEVSLAVWSLPDSSPRVLNKFRVKNGVMLSLSLQYTSDGEQLLFPTTEDTLVFLNPRDGVVGEQVKLDGTIFNARISPDGRSIHAVISGTLAGGPRAESVIWDVKSNRLRHRLLTLSGVSGITNGAAFSPDSGAIAVTDGNGNVLFFDAESGRESWRITTGQRAIDHISWTPGGDQLLIGTVTGQLTRWELSPPPPIEPILPGVTGQQIKFSPDGRKIAVSTLTGKEAATRVFDLSTGNIEHQLPAGHATFSLDGKRIGIQRIHRQIEAHSFDLSDGHQVANFQQPIKGAGVVTYSGLGFTADGRPIMARNRKTRQDELDLWDIAADRSVTTIPDASKTSSGCIFVGDGRTFIRTLVGKPVRVQAWDWVEQREVASLTLPKNAMPLSIQMTGHGAQNRILLVTAMTLDFRGSARSKPAARTDVIMQRIGVKKGADGTGDGDDDSTVIPLQGFAPAGGTAISHDGRLVAIAVRGGFLKLFDTANIDLVLSCRLPIDGDPHLAFTPDGTGLLFTSIGKPLRMIRLDSLRENLAKLGLNW